MNKPMTPRECVLQALSAMILDFRSWLIAETKLLHQWKTQRYAFVVAEGRMVDDVQNMLDSMRKKKVDLPIVIIAVRQITAPPDLSMVMGMPQERNVIIPADPLQRRVKLRTEPRGYHVQLVFLGNDTASADAFSSQFASYIRLMEKRRIQVTYPLSKDLSDQWAMTIFDNTIFPDTVSLEANNIVGGIIDFDLFGLIPRVTAGLPPIYDYGEEYKDGDDVPAGWWVCVEADLFKDRKTPTFERLIADPDTREKSEQVLPNPEGDQP